ncbi:hypothetical protein [Caldimonas tepidiphila]|uniref:hypothetical protein n=1 Tax=Caldimonas tepidiphila TaxID=2315841 RepID=UPI000E5A97BF|nr:hypothetical protein [Caldimonas tepidiphila]
MSNELVRIYDRLADAEQAREGLLASGFPPASVHLTVTNDEAGPVEGNFLVGNGRDTRNRTEDLYDPNFAKVVQRSSCMLTVDVEDEGLRRRASEILDRYGSRDDAGEPV